MTGRDTTGRDPTLHRRRVLAITAGSALAGIAGCATIADFVANRVLGDVTVFNETDARIEGTIEVVDPSGETVLDASFDLPPSDEASDEPVDAPEDDAEGGAADDGESGEDAATDAAAADDGVDTPDGEGAWDDVWTDAGNYDVTVELETAVDGQSSATESIAIDDPEEDMLAVPIGADEFDAGIAFSVAQSWSEFDREG